MHSTRSTAGALARGKLPTAECSGGQNVFAGQKLPKHSAARKISLDFLLRMSLFLGSGLYLRLCARNAFTLFTTAAGAAGGAGGSSRILRLVRVRQMQGAAGEGVLTYSEPAATHRVHGNSNAMQL